MPTPLEKARKKRGLDQWEVARLAGIEQPHYSRVERTGSASRELAEKIAKIFQRQGIDERHVLYPQRREFRRFVPT